MQQTFVGKIISQLVEIPVAYSCSEFLAFFISGKANTFKIFDGNAFPFEFSFLNNFFTDGVINNSAMCPFLPAKPFQNTLCALRAFVLKRTPDFLSFSLYAVPYRISLKI